MNKEIKYCRVCGIYYSESLYIEFKVCSLQCKLKTPYSPKDFPTPVKVKAKQIHFRPKGKKQKGGKGSKRKRITALQKEIKALNKKISSFVHPKPKVTLFYASDEWQKLRYEVLAFYGRKCMCCGTTQGEIHVDHIKPRSKFPELELSFHNMQVLCRACNKGKSNRDCTDWRSIRIIQHASGLPCKPPMRH